MDDRQVRQLQNHMDSLSASDAESWRNSAQQALRVEHDPEHPAWDHVKSVAKWLGLPIGGAALGGAFFTVKRVAQFMASHR